MLRKEVIGDATLYLGDCMEVLPTLGKVDAVVTDPPYGIGEAGGEKHRYGPGRTRFISPKHQNYGWDGERPPVAVFDLIKEAAPIWFICGGNYFADLFPPSMGWLYWDKKLGGDFSDGELIYTNKRMALRSLSVHAFEGLSGGKDRQHPTQKPIKLMAWCLGFIPDANTVLDPFMGSGTTGVACVQLGRSFIGIEREPKYFDIACERIYNAYRQNTLFGQDENVQEVPASQTAFEFQQE
jgi:site-specific DNA-methyltransferase (adenine-specific)/modification methylase